MQKKMFFWSGSAAAGAFFFVKNMFLVLARCRRRLSLWKKHVFGPGVLPQAPFFVKKHVFGPGVLPQALFFVKKLLFSAGTLPQAPFFDEKTAYFYISDIFNPECCMIAYDIITSDIIHDITYGIICCDLMSYDMIFLTVDNHMAHAYRAYLRKGSVWDEKGKIDEGQDEVQKVVIWEVEDHIIWYGMMPSNGIWCHMHAISHDIIRYEII